MYGLLLEMLDPLLLAMLLLGAAITNLWRKHYAHPRGLMILSGLYLVLFIAFTPMTAYFIRGSLEWRYSPPDFEEIESVEAIVVIMGDILPPDELRARSELGPASLRRCVLAAQLYREKGPCLVIVSGGKVDSTKAGPTLAVAGSSLLTMLGIADEQLVLEEESRSTSENAMQTSRLLRERGIRNIALVTDSSHQRRAVLCFRHHDEGLEIIPIGADYRATKFEWQLTAFLPRASAANSIGNSLHEWLGIAWYRLSGKI